MFFNTPGKPNKFKKFVYLTAATILGFLLSIILHALVEIVYLYWAGSQGWIVIFFNGCALPPIFSYILLILGGIGGFFLGRFWWRLVYIERFWEKNKKLSK